MVLKKNLGTPPPKSVDRKFGDNMTDHQRAKFAETLAVARANLKAVFDEDEDKWTFQSEDVKTFENWTSCGLARIRKGVRAFARDIDGTPLFHRCQTVCQLHLFRGSPEDQYDDQYGEQMSDRLNDH